LFFRKSENCPQKDELQNLRNGKLICKKTQILAFKKWPSKITLQNKFQKLPQKIAPKKTDLENCVLKNSPQNCASKFITVNSRYKSPRRDQKSRILYWRCPIVKTKLKHFSHF
jgi:hypothetical protein